MLPIEIWEQNLGDTFKIDASTDGLQKVHLKCGGNSMQIQLETDDDFTGVMYTRGSFYKQTEPCFVRAGSERKRSLEMKFSFNKCQTIQNGEVYTNVVVVQHDPDLVTPGDAAFALECDFRTPRSLTVDANFQANERLSSGSRITLISPDPSVSAHSSNLEDNNNENSVYNKSHSVTFTPSSSSSPSSSSPPENSQYINVNGKKNIIKKHKQLVKGTIETIQLERKRKTDEL